YGRITYKATLPEGVSQYYVQFIYEDEYDGVLVKKEVRRILKNAIGKVELSGYVKNNFKDTLPNAQVIIGTKSVFTDDTGFYKISGLDVGSYQISVTANNHYDFQDTVTLSQKSTVLNMSLTRRAAHGNPIIRYILLNDTLPSRNENIIFYKGIDMDLNLFALIDWKGHDPGYVQFNVNGRIYNKKDARISLKLSELEEGGKLTVTCVTKSGEKSPEYNSGIYVVDSLPDQFPATFVPTYIDGKYVVDQYIKLPEIKTPNIANIPLFAGGPFTFFAEPALLTGAMSHDGSFHAFIGHSTDTNVGLAYTKNNKLQKYIMEKYATTEEQKENIKKGRSRSFVATASMDSTLDASFYWNYDVKTSRWVFKYTEMMLGYNANMYAKYSWGVPGVPLTAYLSANVDVSLNSHLYGYYYTPTTLSYTSGIVDLSKFRITMSGGLDAMIASAGVNFSGEGKVKISYPVYKRDYYIGVRGWVNLKALIWAVDLPFLEYEWGDPSPWNLKKSSMRMNTLSEDSTIMGIAEEGIDNLKPLARDYVNTQSSWLSGTENRLFSASNTNNAGIGTYSSQDGSSALITGTIPYTDHKVIPYGDGAFMVFTEDDPARSDLDRTRAVYTVYKGNSWSQPLPIDPLDQTGDYKPKIAATNKGVIAAWENISEVLPGDAELGDALEKEEIVVAVFDRETGNWSDIRNLTTDRYMDVSPEIAADGDKGILVWVKSKAIDYSDALTADFAPENHIMFSSYDGHTFSEPVSIYQTDSLIVNSSLAYEGDMAAYVFSLDMDKDLSTDADQEIFIMTYNGSEWSAPGRITEDNLKDTKPRVTFLNGKPFLVWHRDGHIVYTRNALANPVVPKLAIEDTKLQENFTLAARNKNNESIILTAPGVSEESQEIYALVYDTTNDVWSNELKLTDDMAINRMPSAAVAGNTLITLYNRAHLEDVINPETGEIFKYPGNSADLMMNTKGLVHDLEITSDGIILSESNVYPGGLVTISALVENKGIFGETGVNVAFYNGDPSNGGKQIGGTKVIEDVIVPGGRGIASVDWDVPVEGLLDEIYVAVDPNSSINDINPLNNKANIKLKQPDIELSLLEAELMGSNNYAVKVKVSNIGGVDLPDSTITFYRGTGEGEIEEIGNINTGELLAGDVKEIPHLLNLPSTQFINNSLDLIATVDAPSEYTEQDLANNVAMLTIKEEYPIIQSYEPGDNSVNVRVDKEFRIIFDREIYQGDTFGDIALKDSGNNIIPATKAINEDTLIVTPSQNLKYNSEYILILPAMSIAGSNMHGMAEDWSISFKTEENKAYPLITALDGITPGQVISIPFSSDIVRDANFNLITMKKVNNGDKIVAIYTITGNVLEIEPLSGLEYNTSYTVAVPEGAMKDKGGRSINSFDFTLTTLEQGPDDEDVFTIIFDKNGGDTEASPAAKKVRSGANAGTLPAAPTRSGYTFSSWNTKANGSGTAFTAATVVAGNITVYAQWTLNNSGGGVIPPGGNGSGTDPDTTQPAEKDTTKPDTAEPDAIEPDTTKPDTTKPEIPKTEINVRGNTIIATTTVAVDVDNEGNGVALVTQEQINDAIDKVLERAGKQEKGTMNGTTMTEIEVRVEAPSDIRTVETNIPKEAVNQSAKSGISAVTVSTPVAYMTFNASALSAIYEKASSDVKITVSKVEASSLSVEVRKMVGDRPVFDFSVTSGGKTISQFGGNVTVSVPYTPQKGEDINAIVIYYINEDGKLETVKDCKYHPDTGRVIFNTDHFSLYMVGYNKVSFKDV
ncbi:MAG TPA: Ig-like domain-containing protein, partial [Clostridiales bacterium]|nr:Ig-like domain-containing protein [Clostridiales bacterium]